MRLVFLQQRQIATRLKTPVIAAVYAPDEFVPKNGENHAAAAALYFMYCNFGRVHQTCE